jgi:1,4-dihydroxy-2-naphthoyl-CoA hydrolase
VTQTPPEDQSPHPLPAHALPSTAGTLMERLGIEIIEMSEQRVVATMPVAGNTQPYGLLHGGASAALAETLGSYAAVLHAGPGRIAVGIELNATHHRGVRDGVVTGTATPLHQGGTVASYAIEIRDGGDRLVCTARLTCVIRSTPPGSAGS